MNIAAAICRDAGALVDGDRANSHGDMLTNMTNIAALWTAILEAKQGRPLDRALHPEDVANMLEAMKIARRYSGTHNRDDYVDGAGYAAVAGQIAEQILNATATTCAEVVGPSAKR